VSDPTVRPIPRARPLADVPVEALAARGEELARSWGAALLLGRPLSLSAEMPVREFAREAPTLCAQAVRALASEDGLDGLIAGAVSAGERRGACASRLAAIVGARDARETVAAVEALRGVLWETLLAEQHSGGFGSGAPAIGRAPASRLAELADRLAYVCASMLLVALDQPVVDADDASTTARVGHDSTRVRGSAGEAVIVDELSSAGRSGRANVSAGVGVSPASGGATERPLSWDESPPVPPRARAGEIEIRDERREQGAAAWTRTIGRQLECFERDGRPFAALLVELLDVERTLREGTQNTLALLSAVVEQALLAELSAAHGSVTPERPGRYWVLAAGVDRAEAGRLAERLQRAAYASMRRHGSSLEVAIGIAACPEDGREAAALAAHADVGLYAARSAVRARTTSVDGPA
jgi:hypothetical protein